MRRPRAATLGSSLGLLLLGVLGSCGGDREVRRPPRPGIILITLDTTRVDHLGCYGYGRQTSPNLDRFARQALRYTRAYATSSWTLPSHASLFTGKLPTSHGARYDPEGPLALTQGIEGPTGWERFRARTLGVDQRPLAQILADNGYSTAAVVAGPWLKRPFGLDRGFERYDDDQISELKGRVASDVTAAALHWLENRPAGPFLLFLNYFDPHSPYEAPGEFRGHFLPSTPEERRRLPRGQRIVALYDAEIRYMDHHLGVLFDNLRRLGLFDECWIIITADHGELLGDNGLLGHGTCLSEAEIHVPLLIKEPSATPRTGTCDALVSLAAIVPTLLDNLHIDPPPGLGATVLPQPAPQILAEVYPLPFVQQNLHSWRQKGAWKALIKEQKKFAWNSLGHHLLIDLGTDPLERFNLLETRPDLARTMAAELDRLFADLPRAGESAPIGQVDEETLRSLERMGYAGGKGDNDSGKK